MILLLHLVFLIAKYAAIALLKSMGNKKDVCNNDANSKNSNEEFTNFFDNKDFKYESKYVDGNLKFFPPVYVQRYQIVALILKEHPQKECLKKVADFGCSEMNFFIYLKNMPNVEEILEIDIDDYVLDQHCNKLQPLNCDYLFTKRSLPLEVYVLAGNIAEYDDFLIGTDVVIAIEVIEHLEPDVLRKMPHNVFHEIKPKIAIFTTPNADFNILFSNIKGFRHVDHKFEWNRKEFYNWTRNIIKEYPDYTVKIYGIGMGPEGTENLGCCTQMAVFERLSESENKVLTHKEIKNYKLIRQIKYPYYVDQRTNEEKIVDEIYYRLRFSIDVSKYFNYDEHIAEVPLVEFMNFICQLCESVEQLKQILINNGLDVREKNGEYVLLYVQNTPEDSTESETAISDEEDISQDIVDDHCNPEDWSLDYESGKVTNSFYDFSSTTNVEKVDSKMMGTIDSKSCLDLGSWEDTKQMIFDDDKRSETDEISPANSKSNDENKRRIFSEE